MQRHDIFEPHVAPSVRYTNGWTIHMERYHLQTMEKTEGYAWMHFAAAAYHRRIFLVLAVPTTLLGVLLGSSGLGSLGVILDGPLWWLYAIIFGLSILNGFLVGLNALLEPNLTSFKHSQSAVDAIQFRRKIETELLTEPARRIDCDDFSEMVNLEYQNLLKTDVAVPSHIIKRYESLVDDHTAKPEMMLPRKLRRNHYNHAASPRADVSDWAQHRTLPSVWPAAPQIDPPAVEESPSQRDRPSAIWMTSFCRMQQQGRRVRRTVSQPSLPTPESQAEPQAEPQAE